jgi:hypothetical protein
MVKGKFDISTKQCCEGHILMVVSVMRPPRMGHPAHFARRKCSRSSSVGVFVIGNERYPWDNVIDFVCP